MDHTTALYVVTDMTGEDVPDYKGHSACFPDFDDDSYTWTYPCSKMRTGITCSTCGGSKKVTKAINCSHSKSSSHWHCGHGTAQSANYHT